MAAVAVIGVFFFASGDETKADYRLAKVERGDFVSVVSASGTLNPVITVAVGSQVSGQISALLADFNTEVGKEQVIARIEPSNFEAQVRQADAELVVASANVVASKAAIMRAHVDLKLAYPVITHTHYM